MADDRIPFVPAAIYEVREQQEAKAALDALPLKIAERRPGLHALLIKYDLQPVHYKLHTHAGQKHAASFIIRAARRAGSVKWSRILSAGKFIPPPQT